MKLILRTLPFRFTSILNVLYVPFKLQGIRRGQDDFGSVTANHLSSSSEPRAIILKATIAYSQPLNIIQARRRILINDNSYSLPKRYDFLVFGNAEKSQKQGHPNLIASFCLAKFHTGSFPTEYVGE